MKIEKTEYGYQVTECDIKFGEQITLDGELLIPISDIEDIRAEVCTLTKLKYSSGERVYLDEVLEIIDKHLGYCRTSDERKNLSYTEVENSEKEFIKYH